MTTGDSARRGTVTGADCAACPFAVEGKPERAVRGIGPDDPAWIIVGEGPGAHETQMGVPVVGPTGQLVDRALAETRTDRRRLWLTNATLCEPRGSDRGEKARAAAAAACRGRLHRELADFPGKPVLAMGSVAAKALVGDLTDLPITEISGSHFEADIDGAGVRDIIPTVHPAALLRGGKDSKGDKGPEKTGGHVASLGFWSLKWDILKVRALSAFRFGGGPDIRLPMRVGEEIEIELVSPRRACELVMRVLADAARTGEIALDYETGVADDQRNSALQSFVAQIRLLGLSSDGRAVSVAWKLLDAKTIQAYRRVLADPAIVKFGHNVINYDCSVHSNSRYRFVDGGTFHDTMLMQHAAWPGAKKKLQHVVSQYYAVAPWKSEFRDKGDSLADEAVYNARDALGCHAASKPGLLWVKKQKVESVYDVDRAKATFAATMHSRGYFVCPDVNAEILRRLTTVIEAANEAIQTRCAGLGDKFIARLASEQAKTQRKGDDSNYVSRIAGREAELRDKIAKGKFQFSPSNDWHAVAFLRACGVQLWKTTATGRTSTGADVLEDLSANHPEVAHLLQLRSNEKQYDFSVRMFQWVQDSLKKWQPPFVQDDGRVHPRWAPVQISGRFSSEDPASSNWTEGDETNPDVGRRLPNIRRQIVAPPGRAIVAFDMAQLEARLMAVQSGDPFLCRVFADGLDIHHEFGVIVFPVMETLDRKSEAYSKLRNLTKRVEYGALYGGSDITVHKAVAADEPSLAGPAGLKQVKAAITKMKLAVGGVTAWQNKLLLATSAPPYTLRSYILGRMRVFPLGDPPPTDIANNPNQFAGADIMDTGLVRMLPRLAKYRGTAFPILHQHDAIYFECAEADALALARDVRESFATEVKAVNGQMIQFPVEIKVGYAYHAEPGDKQKAKHPQLVWPVGRPGLKQVEV